MTGSLLTPISPIGSKLTFSHAATIYWSLGDNKCMPQADFMCLIPARIEGKDAAHEPGLLLIREPKRTAVQQHADAAHHDCTNVSTETMTPSVRIGVH